MVSNPNEIDTIENKIRAKFFSSRVIRKEDLLKEYKKFFDYKSSIFLILYFFAFIVFGLILYERYHFINSIDKKNIAILKSLGWDVKDIIKLKLLQSLVIFTTGFILGIFIAYIYVFILDAPILKELFLGFNNLSLQIKFIPIIDFTVFIFLFIILLIPVIAVTIIPIWKIAITSAYEASR
jgi:ABC-type lipoprotein release transport system permease subunit